MKLIKLLFVGLFVVNCITATAQEEKGKNTSADQAARVTQKMSKELGLDVSKTEKLAELNKNLFDAIAGIKEDEKIAREEKKGKIETALSERREGLKNILTEDQFAKYEKMEADKKAAMEAKKNENAVNRLPENKAAQMTDKMSKEFSLDEEKTAELSELNLKFLTDMEVIKSDMSIPREEKKTKIERLMNERSEGLKNILSEENFLKFETKEADKKAAMEARKKERMEKNQKEDTK